MQRTVIRKAKTGVIGERKGVPECGGTKRSIEQEQGSQNGGQVSRSSRAQHSPLQFPKTPRSRDKEQ